MIYHYFGWIREHTFDPTSMDVLIYDKSEFLRSPIRLSCHDGLAEYVFNRSMNGETIEGSSYAYDSNLELLWIEEHNHTLFPTRIIFRDPYAPKKIVIYGKGGKSHLSASERKKWEAIQEQWEKMSV